MTKTSVKLFLPVLALALLLPFSAKAFAVKTGNAVNIGQADIVEGNLYAAASTLSIDGRVKGDVICAGQSVIITGQVDGDVLCAAQSISILGDVSGSVRVAGSDVNLNSKVGRNVMAFGASAMLGSKADVGMDMLVAAGFTDINGKIAGSLHGSAGVATINGQIGKDVALNIDSDDKNKMSGLTVMEGAKIGGNLEYTSASQATIANNDSIGGKVVRQLPRVDDQNFNESILVALAGVWLWYKIIALFGTLLIGLVLVLCFKRKLLGFLDQMVDSPGVAIGWGALFLFVTPFALLFLMITVIGIPLAFLLGLLWLAAMILGKLLVSIFVGLLIMGRYRHKRPKNDNKGESTSTMLLSMLIGVVIACALFTIPIFGWFLALIAKMWGLGIIWLSLRKCCLK